MKKSFIGTIAVAFSMAAVSYAQDSEYEDYAYDEGVAESAPESEDNSTAVAEDNSTAQSSYTATEETAPVETATTPAPASNSIKPLRWGGHLGLGFSGTYGSEKVPVISANSVTVEEKDPFSGFIGVNVDFGGMIAYRVNQLFGVNAELNFHVVDYFHESDVWTYRNCEGYYCTEEPVDENMMMVGINIPIYARLYPVNQVYAEAGAQINLNMYGKFSLDNSDYDYSEDMGDWEIETFGVSALVGGGIAHEAGKGIVEFGARLVIDFTQMEKEDTVVEDANSETMRPSVPAKGWHIQLICNYLI